MKTLYDVLDVAPNCGAGIVAEAFRRAVKINHPDVNADDPEAAARFRQIVRAKTILGDPELRAVYDRMLDFEHQQLHPMSKTATTLDARHIVVLAVVLAGAFTLFTYISEAPVAKVKVTEDTAHEAVNVVASNLRRQLMRAHATSLTAPKRRRRARPQRALPLQSRTSLPH